MSDSTHIDRFPREWATRLAHLPRQLTVNVAGYSVTLPLEAHTLTGVYLPVLNLLVEHLGEKRRIVAGLAGIPGSGKSTFAAVLAVVSDVLLGMGRLVAVGIDGWHWPNAVLDVRTTHDEAGHPVPLRQRKGGPESFDVDAIAAALSDLQDPNRTVALPVYDRRVHDPVADGIRIGPGTAIVLVEGNFVLDPAPPWNKVSAQLQPRLFLEHHPAAARERVIERHVRGGLTSEEAAHKYDANDRLNATAVLATAAHADYVVRFQPAPHVDAAATGGRA